MRVLASSLRGGDLALCYEEGRHPGLRRLQLAQSTVPEQVPLQRLQRARALRRAYLAALSALVILGLAGFAGERIVTVSGAAEGWELEVRYSTRSRAGMSADMRFVVRRDGGFDGPITLAISADYLEMLDDHGLMPEPSATTADDSFIEFEFDPPEGDTFQVLYKGRIDPTTQRGRRGIVAILDGGAPVVSVDVVTGVLP